MFAGMEPSHVSGLHEDLGLGEDLGWGCAAVPGQALGDHLSNRDLSLQAEYGSDTEGKCIGKRKPFASRYDPCLLQVDLCY